MVGHHSQPDVVLVVASVGLPGQVRGNAELYWAYFAALTRLFDVMRDVENNR